MAEARQAAARKRWEALPSKAQAKLEDLEFVCSNLFATVESLQEWWARNEGSLDSLGINVDTHVGPKGSTALCLACACGNPEIARYLVEVCGANVNLREEFSGTTPVISAILHYEETCVRTLLELGADPNLRDGEHGMTAFEFAESKQNKECIALLDQWAPAVKSALKG